MIHGVAFAVTIWIFAIGGCGGKAATSDKASGDGDGDVSADGGSAGDGDGDVSPGSRTCRDTSDCLLVSTTCCGTCGTPTLASLTSINVNERAEYVENLCRDQPGCPDCLAVNNPNLYAVCNEGTCEAVDLRSHADSACSTPDDCVLLPDACCECGASTDPDQMVSIHRDRASDFITSQCTHVGLGEPVGCDDCLWTPPRSYDAGCDSGHCTVILYPL